MGGDMIYVKTFVNFMIFMDDKNPRKCFIEKIIYKIYYTFITVGIKCGLCETNKIAHAVRACISGDTLDIITQCVLLMSPQKQPRTCLVGD